MKSGIIKISFISIIAICLISVFTLSVSCQSEASTTAETEETLEEEAPAPEPDEEKTDEMDEVNTEDQAVPEPEEEAEDMEEEAQDADSYMDISPKEAKELIEENPGLIIIDVSPRYDEGHIPGAINYYVGDGSLDAAIPDLDPSAEYLVYCHSDSASIAGAQKLIDAGFKNVYRLEGNYSAWVDAGYEIETSEEEIGEEMKITSTEFENESMIPSKYTCDGDNINPPLSFNGIPSDTVSLVLVVDDPDAPGGTWLHWTVWNIDPAAEGIPENSVPAEATEGVTDFGTPGYGGPCPPSGTHRYFFKIYAIDMTLDLDTSTSVDALMSAIEGHILGQAELIGLYERS